MLTEQQKQQILGQMGRGSQPTTALSAFNAKQLAQINSDDDVKKLKSIDRFQAKLKDYQGEVEKIGKFKVFKTAQLDRPYGELKIAYKEAANLGALTGPDIAVLEETVKPVSGGLGKFVKFKLAGGTDEVLAALDSLKQSSQSDKDYFAQSVAVKYGKKDPYMQFLVKDTKTGQPNQLDVLAQMNPGLAQLIEERKQKLIQEGKLPAQAPISPEQPQQPDERSGFEKGLSVVSAPFRALTGKTGKTIGEALGTQIAKAKATPEERQFITPGPSKGAMAKDIGFAALEVGAGAGAGKLLKGGLKLAAPLISKLQKSRRLKQALDLIKPSLSTAEKEAAIASGRVKTSRGLLGKTYEVPPSNYDLEVAETVQGIVKKGWKPEKNIETLRKNVSKIDAQIQEGLSIRNAPVNRGQVKNFLDKIKNSEETQFITAGDTQAKQIYESVINNFLGGVRKLDNKGLFDARKAFDKTAGAQIRNLFGEQFGNVRKQAVLDIRRGVNDFISKNLPQGKAAENLIFKEALKKEHHMLNAIENIAEQTAKKVGKPTPFQKIKKTVFSPQAIGTGIAVGVLGGLGRAITGNQEEYRSGGH